MKKFIFGVALGLLAVVAGCGREEVVSKEEAQKMASIAKSDATVEEARKADAKLREANAELSRLAKETARKGGFSAQANCNVMPAELPKTGAVKNFPSTAPDIYKDQCQKEVVAMNAERANAKREAVIAERKRLQKIADANKARTTVAKKKQPQKQRG